MKFIYLFLFLFLFSFVSAELNIGYDVDVDVNNVILDVPETPINYSLVNVNNSQYLQGYTPSTLYTYYKSLFDDIYCELTGCTMEGDIDMDDHDITNADNFNMTGVFRQGVDGNMFVYDTGDEIHHVNADLEKFDELRVNTFSTNLNLTTFYNSTGYYINISAKDGGKISFITAVGPDAISETFDETNYVLELTAGTNETPLLNRIYAYISGGEPVWGVSISGPTIKHAMAARILLGADDNVPYAASLQEDGQEGFLKRVQRRFRKEGLLYESGFDYIATATDLNIGNGSYINGIYDSLNTGEINISEGFYIVHTNGSYQWYNGFDEITEYSDGTSIGVNKYFNIIFGVTPYNGATNIYGVVQSEPNTEYTSVALAYADSDNTVKVYPSEEFLKTFFLPTVRIVIKRGSTAQILPNGYYAEDYRGGVAGGVSSGGGLSETDPIWTADKPDYFRVDGTSTMQGNANFGGYNITNVGTLFTNNIGTVSLDEVRFEDHISLRGNELREVSSINGGGSTIDIEDVFDMSGNDILDAGSIHATDYNIASGAKSFKINYVVDSTFATAFKIDGEPADTEDTSMILALGAEDFIVMGPGANGQPSSGLPTGRFDDMRIGAEGEIYLDGSDRTVSVSRDSYFAGNLEVTGNIVANNFQSGNSLALYGQSEAEFQVTLYYKDVVQDGGTSYVLRLSGAYDNDTNADYDVEIDGYSANVWTFKWRRNGGTWTTGVPVTGFFSLLENGIKVSFLGNASTVPTIGDAYSFTAVAEPVSSLLVDTVNDLTSVGGRLLVKRGTPTDIVASGTIKLATPWIAPNEDLVPTPVPEGLIEADGWTLTFTNGTLSGNTYNITNTLRVGSESSIGITITSGWAIGDSFIINGQTPNLAILDVDGTLTVDDISTFNGQLIVNDSLKLAYEIEPLSVGQGLKFNNDFQEVDFNFNDLIDIDDIFSESIDLEKSSIAVGSLEKDVALSINNGLGGTITDKYLIEANTSGNTNVVNLYGMRLLDTLTYATNNYGITLESDHAGWGAVWWGAANDMKQWFDGTDGNIDVTLTSPSSELNIIGNINNTNYNMTSKYYYGDGSLLTGISGGIWTDVSGVATYNGNVNATGDMIIGNNINVEENITASKLFTSEIFTGTGTDASIGTTIKDGIRFEALAGGAVRNIRVVSNGLTVQDWNYVNFGTPSVQTNLPGNQNIAGWSNVEGVINANGGISLDDNDEFNIGTGNDVTFDFNSADLILASTGATANDEFLINNFDTVSISGNSDIGGKLNVSESIEYNGTLITHSPFVTCGAEENKCFFADFSTETTGWCRKSGRGVWSCDSDNIEVLKKLEVEVSRETSKNVCKENNYSWSREGCYEIVKVSKTRSQVAEQYNESIYEQVNSTRRVLDDNLNVVVETYGKDVLVDTIQKYRLKKDCGWNEKDEYYCMERVLR